MTLGRAHEVALATAVTLACLTALLGGSFSPFAWLALGAPWVSAFLRPKGRHPPATSGTIIALASVALGIATVVSQGAQAAVLGGGYALLGLLVARVLVRRTLAHDGQVLLLSLLLVVAGSVLNLQLSYGVLFFIYGVVVVWALITRELLRGAERSAGADERRLTALRSRRDVVTLRFLFGTSAVAAALLLTTVGLFAIFPRLGFASLGGLVPQRDGQMPPSVSLRGAPRGSSGSSDVVARVRGVPWEVFSRGLYLRGPVYDALNEQGFERTEVTEWVRDHRLVQPGPGPSEHSYEVYLNPGAGGLLFALGGVHNAVSIAGGHANPSRRVHIRSNDATSELRAQRALRTAMTYRVTGSVAAPGYLPERSAADDVGPGALRVEQPKLAAAYLALPEELDPRLANLAREITRGATTDTERVARLRAFFLERFEYTLLQPNAQEESPLSSFLIDDRRGHCEYFATGFGVLLRTLGIPARVVGGYQGGAWDDAGDRVVFMKRHAHAWVEWYLPGVGWVVDDPTPVPSAPRERLGGWAGVLERLQRFWDDRVVDLSLQDQISLIEQLGRALRPSADEEPVPWRKALVLTAILGLVAVLAIWWRRYRRRGPGTREAGLHEALLASLLAALAEARGEPVGDAATLRELVADTPADDPLAAPLRRALDLYERRRFGAEVVPAAEVEQAVDALQTAARGPGSPPRGEVHQ